MTKFSTNPSPCDGSAGAAIPAGGESLPVRSDPSEGAVDLSSESGGALPALCAPAGTRRPRHGGLFSSTASRPSAPPSSGNCTGKPPCEVCSTTSWRDGHVMGGRLLCSRCWRDLAQPMDSKPAEQLALNLAQAAQREGGCRG
jgi:hypothetical protein